MSAAMMTSPLADPAVDTRNPDAQNSQPDFVALGVAPFDPRDPAFLADPYPTYAALRDRHPVWRRPGRGDWVITSRADIARLLRAAELGHGEPGPELDGSGSMSATILAARRSAMLWFTKRNAPDHGRLRGVVRDSLSPAALHALDGLIRTETARLLNMATGPFDLMRDLARPLPALVIAALIGIPEGLRVSLMAAIRRTAPAADIDPGPEREAEGWFALSMVNMGFRRLLLRAADEGEPTRGLPPLVSRLAAARRRGVLSEDEAVAQLSLMLFAGHATTEALIGNLVLTLLRHPDQLALLRERPSLIDGAIEEVLRVDPPAQVVTRTALADLEIGGRVIRAGDRVLLVIAAAGHEPERPFDVTSGGARGHMAFGAGMHACPGAMLARAQARIAVGSLIAMAPDLHLAGPARWNGCYAVRGLESLPLAWSERPGRRPA